MAIETIEFDLSMIDQNTGRYLTGRVYTVDGITNADNSLRELSIGQLVMALCLDRAAALEASIIELMEKMNETSARLAGMTEVEQRIVDLANESTGSDYWRLDTRYLTTEPYNGVTLLAFLTEEEYGVELDLGDDVTKVRVNDTTARTGEILYDDFISLLEAKMDDQNSFSQQKMIELQSQTSKRDQSYDMISNILKSLNTVLVGNANNL